MPGEKKEEEKTEAVLDEANQEVLDYVNSEEAEADKLFNEINNPDGDPEKKAEEEPEKKAEKKEEETAKEPEEKEEEKAEEDLTKGLTVENAEKRIAATQKQMHSSNERASTTEKENVRLREEMKALTEKLEQKASASPAKEEPGEKEEAKVEPSDSDLQASLTELEQEYPEIAKPMLKMMAKQDAENKVLRERLDEHDKKEEERVQEKVDEDKNSHVNTIAEVHEDYEEVSAEPLFNDWIQGLPAIERKGAESIRKDGSAKEVIELLTSFKKANGYKVPGETKEDTTPKSKADSKLAKAKGLSTPTFNKTKDVNIQDKQIKFTQEQIHNMSDKEFAEQEPEIDKALAEGLVA